MNAQPFGLAPVAIVAALTLCAGAVAGVAFADWMEHGSSILMTMAESGLSWCF